jgi:hypothetical protein
MALIESPERFTIRRLLLVGLPSFLLAVVVSILSHDAAHAIMSGICQSGDMQQAISSAPGISAESSAFRPLISLAGPAWTFVLALIALPFFLRAPANLFYASMVFVNASLRLPETLRLLVELFGNGKAVTPGDEANALALLPFSDPSAMTAVLYFYLLLSVFLVLTVIHDTKVVPWKWGIALVLFASLVILKIPLSGLIFPHLR